MSFEESRVSRNSKSAWIRFSKIGTGIETTVVRTPALFFQKITATIRKAIWESWEGPIEAYPNSTPRSWGAQLGDTLGPVHAAGVAGTCGAQSSRRMTAFACMMWRVPQGRATSEPKVSGYCGLAGRERRWTISRILIVEEAKANTSDHLRRLLKRLDYNVW